ncbi:hypothetical protein NLJ89_g399 [Agrocybe chaxingu]|uniref:RING-type domain-containing protein n=1 Tax=Agrocybe chaxingu TaxID=84603 RepID=A0A9W8N1Y4_9AGAR|nr:hypothetical protein NLJ89_g399 [Agrocybe chaxingu]
MTSPARLPMDQDMSSAGGLENNRVEPTEQPGGSSEMNVSLSSPEQFVQRSTVRRWSPQPYAAVEAAWNAAGFTGFPPLPTRGDEALSLAGSNHFSSADAHIWEPSSYPALVAPGSASSSSGKRKREHTSDSEDEAEAAFNVVNSNEGPATGPSSLSTALHSPASSLGKRKRDPDSDGEMDSIPSVPPSQEPANLSQQSSHAESESEIAQQLSLNDGYVSGPHVSDPVDDAGGQSSAGKGKRKAKDRKGKGKAKAPESDNLIQISDSPTISALDESITTMAVDPPVPNKPPPELMSSYTCPICFSPPTNATLTPCGHICCGACLFTAVKTTIQRATLSTVGPGASDARCPVCRAIITGWDGKGGGVIGLKARAIFRL